MPVHHVFHVDQKVWTNCRVWEVGWQRMVYDWEQVTCAACIASRGRTRVFEWRECVHCGGWLDKSYMSGHVRECKEARRLKQDWRG